MYIDRGPTRTRAVSGLRERPRRRTGASTSRCHWSRTGKESRAARGPEEQVPFRGADHADVGHGGANRFTLNSDRRSSVRILIEQPLPVRSREQRNDNVARKDSNIAVDLTESIKGETVNHHQSSIDQNRV